MVQAFTRNELTITLNLTTAQHSRFEKHRETFAVYICLRAHGYQSTLRIPQLPQWPVQKEGLKKHPRILRDSHTLRVPKHQILKSRICKAYQSWPFGIQFQSPDSKASVSWIPEGLKLSAALLNMACLGFLHNIVMHNSSRCCIGRTTGDAWVQSALCKCHGHCSKLRH